MCAPTFGPQLYLCLVSQISGIIHVLFHKSLAFFVSFADVDTCIYSPVPPFPPRLATDPFAKTVPDHVDSVLSYGVEDATVCCFDKRGAYLAVGYATGIVVIWDFVTR